MSGQHAYRGLRPDPEGRRARGRRIVAALADFGGVDVGRARILDVGCSSGGIAHEIARAAAATVGVDVDADALRTAADAGGMAAFARADGSRLPFADGAFDAVVCNHVYEHVDEPFDLMREVARVLRPGGVCYFAGGHTLQLIEPHHRLPLLTCMPRSMASAILRATGRDDRYRERFLRPWRLSKLFTGFAAATFVSPAMLAQPARFEIARLARAPAPLRGLVRAIRAPLARLAPTWIYLLRK